LCCPLVVHSTLVSKVRSNRKGAVASATSATLGMIFILLAAGYPRAALVGHAAFRMFQILCASNVILDSQGLRSALGFSPWPRIVPDLLYRIAWALRRFDFHVIIFCIELVAHFLPYGPNLEGCPDLSSGLSRQHASCWLELRSPQSLTTRRPFLLSSSKPTELIWSSILVSLFC
jgi:hypothetical protein